MKIKINDENEFFSLTVLCTFERIIILAFDF